MKYFRRITRIVSYSALVATVSTSGVLADIENLSDQEEEQLSAFTDIVGRALEKRTMMEGSATFFGAGPDVIVTPGTGTDDGFGGNPGDNPSPYPYPDVDTTGLDLPFVTRKSGAAELLALEALYQTLMFYGVVHIVERQGSKRTFKIVESKSGYFKNLTSLDVAFAIRAFSLYIVGLLCNDPSMMNFARLQQQVKPEEIGLRFKYDMAWALLGNYLPREPNDMFKLGTRWKGLSQIFQSTRSFSSMNQGQMSELRSWVTSLGDVVNIVTRLNKLMCFVDVRPDPREEIKKRMVITGLLNIDKRLNDRYADLKEIVDEIERETKASKLADLKASNP